jgi:thymidine kinase
MLFDVIGIDEGQFFDDICNFAETAANLGKIVILSALNGTYEKKGWENILQLIPLCEKVKKLSAICKICSANASFTFRTASGDSQEMIGGADMYMPLCRDCY